MLRKVENSMPLVAAQGLCKTFVQRRGFFRAGLAVPALRGVSLEIQAGSTVVLCGESGSGKSTLARCLAGIEAWDGGDVWLEGRRMTQIPSRQRMAAFRSVQLLFQDSASSLNPSFTAEEIITEPLVIARLGTAAERSREAQSLMAQVGLNPAWASRRPLEFSGGQRQRMAIARVLAANARLIIFDEAFTGLDLLTREQIIGLLRDLQAVHGLTYLHITHDADWAARWAGEMMVMKHGDIVERKKLVGRTAETGLEAGAIPVPAGAEA